MISGPRQQTARYGAVILLGFGIDFGITLALSRLVGLSLELSAAIGFLSALALNYILFEFWVFRGDSAFSATRLSQTALAAGAALSMRVGIIWLVGKVLGNTLPEVVGTILLAAGASVLVNYLLLCRVFAHS
jgi:putative flippase GtrA